MDKLRLSAKPFAERNRSILYDIGTLGGSARRDEGRKAARMALEKCPDGRIRMKPKGGPLETWPLYASHQFAIAPVGVGYDTFRVWEYLFFGTVPIVLSSPLDAMYIDAHVPIIIVKDWKEVCEWTDDDIETLFQRFHKWIANSHMWLRPSLWVPRDQNQMDKLCDASPGCRSGGQFYNAKKLDDKKSTARRNAYQNESKVKSVGRALVKMLGMGGRLGDQMFMYASTLAFAHKYNLNPCLEKYLEPREEMANMFVGPFTFCEDRHHDINWNWEGGCSEGRPEKIASFSRNGTEGKTVGLWGYMHWADYFLEIKEGVFEAFTLVPELQSKADDNLRPYRDAVLVGVHVRRGDRSNIAGRWDATYYERGLRYMRNKYAKNGKNVIFIVASDGKDWVKKQDVFKTSDVKVLEGTSYQEDLAILINCNHAILSGGGFGFWFAFLGPWQHKGEVLINKHQEPCSRLEEWTFIEDAV